MKKNLILGSVIFIIVACSNIRLNPTTKRNIASFAEDKIPPEAEIYPYRVHLDIPHEMRIINNGIGALYQRIQMIRSAQKTIDLEYFIFNADSAGKMIVTELAKAAKRGVVVRVLVDKSAAVFAMNEYYAKVFKENKIDIRYYNAASALRVSSVQFRNHRKLIVRDGEEAITGGRNIADEYFNLAEKFNFLDRDVWVKGEIVKAMQKTFDLYWDSKIVQVPHEISPPEKKIAKGEEDEFTIEQQYKYELNKYYQKIANAKKLAILTEEDSKKLEYVMSYGPKVLVETESHTCPSVAFATDREGGNFFTRIKSDDYNLRFRQLRKEIAMWISKVDQEIILDSPYFLNDKNSREVLDNLLTNEKKVTILTNSLASTDAVYVSTVFSEEVKKYTPNKNFNAYIYRGTFSGESELYSDSVRNSNWGTHSKTILFNDNAFMVGTFNVDNRSNFYNSEMAIFCQGSPELAKDVENSIRTRMKMSHHLNALGKPDDGTKLLEGNSVLKKIEYYILKVPSSIMEFLL
jgi:putative cardiolipin synthase